MSQVSLVGRVLARKQRREPAEKIEYGYFLNEGMTSLVVITSDGRSVEVGIVGREGVVGHHQVDGPRLSLRCRRRSLVVGRGVPSRAALLRT